MCLAIPAKVTKLQNQMGTVDMEGVQREVSMLLLEDVKVGDYVIVHAGFAIHQIDAEEAKKSLEVLHELAAFASGAGERTP